MELLLSDGRAVRVPGRLGKGGFAGNRNANWFLVDGLTYYYKPVGIQDVMGRASEKDKEEIIAAIPEHLAEIGSSLDIIFE